MTTACGSTTSSPDTPLTLSLEEAPFWRYLEILRAEGFEVDADASEVFYVETLSSFDYTREQVMQTSFQNLVKAIETVLDTASKEIEKIPLQSTSISGPVLRGEGADKLTDVELNRLLVRQIQLHEEEKMRKGM